MKKTAVAIFAHPDDEAFGPAGTLHLLTKDYDVHLICATRGEYGHNASKNQHSPIGDIRELEVKQSAEILGINHVHFLDFVDGTLCNNLYHDIAKKINEYIEPLQPELAVTFEPQGVTGHLDHIAISMITSYIFIHNDFMKELWYFCCPEEVTRQHEDYFVYYPPGYQHREIHKTVDISDVYEVKMNAMQAHSSQQADITNYQQRMTHFPKHEHFLIKKK